MIPTQKSILYIGLDIETLFLLHSENDFSIVGTTAIDNFNATTYNPINYIFKLLYIIRCKDKVSTLEHVCLIIWKLVKPLSSSVFRKYAEYLVFLSEKEIAIYNLDNNIHVQQLRAQTIDLIVVNVWGILTKEIILLASHGAINIHPSKLPGYRGAVPTLWALKNHERSSAVTYIMLDESVDGGNILSQYPFNIEVNANWLDLEIAVANIIKQTLSIDIKNYFNGKLKAMPQNKNMTTYTPKYYEYLRINPINETCSEILNKVNLYPYLDPGTYCYLTLNGSNYFLRGVKPVNQITLLHKYTIRNGKLFFKVIDGVLVSRLFFDIPIIQSLSLLTNTLFRKI